MAPKLINSETLSHDGEAQLLVNRLPGIGPRPDNRQEGSEDKRLREAPLVVANGNGFPGFNKLKHGRDFTLVKQAATQYLVNELLDGVLAKLAVDKDACVKREERNDVLIGFDESLEALSDLLDPRILVLRRSIEGNAQLNEGVVQIIRVVFVDALGYSISYRHGIGLSGITTS